MGKYRFRAVCTRNDGPPQIFLANLELLTHGGQVMHICASKLVIIGSGNGWSPGYLNQC